MATHSSTLAWEIPWTEEPGELVHGVTRVRHDLLTKTTTITYKIYAKVYVYLQQSHIDIFYLYINVIYYTFNITLFIYI